MELPKPADYVGDLAHMLSPCAVARLDVICGELDRSRAHTQFNGEAGRADSAWVAMTTLK
jgi:hypothetical protein